MPETEKLTDKVREKKMGELFADMEKMDIQAERRNTANAERRADNAEKRANRAEKRAAEAQKHLEEAQQLSELTEKNSIKSIVELCQELGAPKAAAAEKLMEKMHLGQEEALEKTALYWKE